MKLLDHALELASKGFYIFPLKQGTKLPAIKDFSNLATREPDQIKIWWVRNPAYNIGIYTGKFNGNGALIAVDVDNKGDKKGDETLFNLELEGFEFPETFTQSTPTGGKHLVYHAKEPVKQGVSVLGPGLDIRSSGGYIVGAGSLIEGKPYFVSVQKDVHDATEKLIFTCKKPREKDPIPATPIQVNQESAFDRATHYLVHEAPLSIEGQHGDNIAYIVACKLKDFGLTPTNSFQAMLELWNDRCQPPWSPEDLEAKVQNAYRYGSEFPGSKAPEAQFTAIEPEEQLLHPVLELNKEYAFVTMGGAAHILWETTDPKGFFKLEHLAVQAFHQKLASKTIFFGGKTRQLSDVWMKSPDRRSYDGLCFVPGRPVPERFYNLWKGFAVEPTKKGFNPTATAKNAVDMFLYHLKENVCGGSESLTKWLTGYFAHLIQRPWEKPLVALVFRGGKGVGKNALIERIGYLLNGHFMLADNPRYLTGNFNAHLENTLLFALDEAFWSGDKKAEGTLKNLITGQKHLIERKGSEAYMVENCTRVVIIGNESWLVPASHDERRFAVFDVGAGKKQDSGFFKTIREGMEAGGYSYLLRYLMDFDISKVDVNLAPITEALMDQKIESLHLFHQWWMQSLIEGRISHSDFGEGWPEVIEKQKMREAYRRFCKERGANRWLESDVAIGRLLCSCLAVERTKRQVEGVRLNAYKLPPLAECRKQFEAFMGHPMTW